jgi:ankyrin repeat protein
MITRDLLFTIVLTGFLIPTAVIHAMDADDKITAAQAQEQAREMQRRERANASLFEAIETNNAGLAERAVKEGADIEKSSCSEYSPLSLAVMAGNVTIVDILLDAKADINAKEAQRANFHLASPLGEAACYGNVGLVKRLLDGKADIHSLEGVSPLIRASMSGEDDLIFCLLFVEDHNSIAHIIKMASPFDSEYLNIVRMLLVKNANVNEELGDGSKDEFGPLKMAIKAGEGNMAMVRLLILAGAKTDKLDQLPAGWIDSRGTCWDMATPAMRQAIEDAKEEARTAPDRVAIMSDYLLNGPLAVPPLVDLFFEFEDALFFAARRVNGR